MVIASTNVLSTHFGGFRLLEHSFAALKTISLQGISTELHGGRRDMPKARIHYLVPRCHGMRERAGKQGCEESRITTYIAAQEGKFTRREAVKAWFSLSGLSVSPHCLFITELSLRKVLFTILDWLRYILAFRCVSLKQQKPRTRRFLRRARFRNKTGNKNK